MLKRAFNVHKRFNHSECIFVEMSEHTDSVNFMGYFKQILLKLSGPYL